MHSRLENKINYRFSDKKLLEEALTHKSYSVENNLAFYNERFEFLGDSVLGLAVCDYLFREHPRKDEGYLSKLKSYIVSKSNLSLWAQKIGLEQHIKLASGEKSSGGALKPSILSNAFEALIGAVYLDGGYEKAQKTLFSFLESQEELFTDIDFKSKFQEYSQKKHRQLPAYEVISTQGPEHDKTFVVTLRVGGKTLSTGKGKSKKEAEQNAAENAIKYLEAHQHKKS
ncbi:MAG: ribonuclease III [Elusimicrobia bacterium CG08_land_8_20_14_0_20_51_18]|nr:MAG: ribonuclease III [Elusimicrobia bacterium CG08_land_8_20_14_0_20_51_18]